MSSKWAALASSSSVGADEDGGGGGENATGSWASLAMASASNAVPSSWLRLAQVPEVSVGECMDVSEILGGVAGAQEPHAEAAIKKRKVGRPPKKADTTQLLEQAPFQDSATSSGALQACRAETILSGLFQIRDGHDSAMCSLPATMFAASEESYVREVVKGLTEPSINGGILLRCLAAGQHLESTLDNAYLQLHKCFLATAPESFHYTSTVKRAEELGVSRTTLPKKLYRLVNAQLLSATLLRSGVEQIIGECFGDVEKLAYVDSCAYDETPLKTSIANLSGVQPPGGVALHGAGGSLSDVAAVCALPNKVKDSAITKILQSKQQYGMVLKSSAGCLSFIGHTPNPLQSMERGTAEVLATCLEQSSAVSHWAADFKCKSRCACTDMNPANPKADKHIAASRGDWCQLHMFCEVHHTSRIFIRSFDKMIPDHIRGMLHAALSLRYAAGMAMFRRCLKSVIRERLIVMQGAPSAEAYKYRQLCVELFLPDGGSLVKRMLLQHLPNGDWRNSSAVEHYPSNLDGGLTDSDQISAVMEEGLTYCLAGKAPPAWPNHRWTGAAESVDALGILCACHGLIIPAYEKFASCVSASSTDLPAPHHGSNNILCGDDPRPVASDPTQDCQANSHVGLEMPGQLGEAPSQIPENLKSAEQHKHDVKVALDWLHAENPLGMLIACRLMLEPLRTLLHRQFEVVSERWEVKQRVLMAQHLLKTDNDMTSRPRRHWMLTVAAHGLHEQEFFQSLQDDLFDDKLWWMMPSSCCTAGFNNMFFSILSRQGCCVEHYLGNPHRTYPWAIFKAIHNPDFLEEVRNVKPCLLDAWTRNLLETLHGRSDTDIQQVLICHAQLLGTNISNIEAGHASIRRCLVLQSTQTATMDFAYTSAMWVAQTFRTKTTAGLRRTRNILKLKAERAKVWT
eukprot:3449492-Amphidinium_carterae.5